MKKSLGQEFNEVLARLEKAEEIKNDTLITTDDLRVNDGKIIVKGIGNVGFTDTGFAQFCNRFGMPTQYAKKCLQENPSLFTNHMSHWIENYDSEKQMLFRLYGNRVRAVLSDRYGIMDNYPIAQQISREIDELGNAELQGNGISSDYFDLRFRFPDQKQVIGKLNNGTDDWVMPGIHIRNSETGLSKLLVTFYIDRLVCSNGMTRSTDASKFTRRHVGKMEIDINDRIHDVIQGWEQPYMEYVDLMRSSKDQKVDTLAFFEQRIGNHVNKNQAERIKKAWFEESGDTRHHLVQAITASARDTKNWSERLELESFASKVLEGVVA